MPHVIGVDCSTKAVHAVCLDANGDIYKKYKITTDKTDMDYKVLHLVAGFEQACENEEVALFIENPVYIQNVKVSFAICSIVSGIKYLWFKKGRYFTGVDVRSWKKDVLGNGKAEKDAIMAFAKARWGKEITEQDFADAACIALYGLRRLGNNGKV